MRIAVGMSGFAYKEWRGSFYPDDLPADGMLRHYASCFPTVEINNTFYRMPSEKLLLDWAAQVPEDFRFTIKASRRITHFSRLQGVEELLAYLVRNVAVLGSRLGPLLFQLPPTLKKEVPRLEAFLAQLPPGLRVAIQCQHATWFDEEVYQALRRHGAALVAAEYDPDALPPLVATTEWGYVRCHRAGYTEPELAAWLERIRAQPWQECLVYFQHEEDIAGPSQALAFQGMVERTEGE